MAGTAVKITVDVDDRQIRRALERLRDAGGDVREAAMEIGETLLDGHEIRFDEQVDPDGQPWEPLSQKTVAWKARKGQHPDKILKFSGDLSDLLRYQASSSGVEFGTDRDYGATHQYGDESRNIPERPFLGIDSSDQRIILEILEKHIEDALKGKG